jgi:sugar (pentulose or hexulose) kinase
VSGHLHIEISSRGFAANDAGLINLATDDADALFEAVSTSLEGIDFSNVTRIRVTGRPVRPIMWEHDESSVPDAGWCLKKHDESWWSHEVGVTPTFRSMVTKLSWMHRSEPELWARTSRLCTPAQYVRWRLGRDTSGPILARASEMVVTALWNSTSETISDAVTTLIDADRNWSGVFPRVRPDDSAVGSLYGVLVVL